MRSFMKKTIYIYTIMLGVMNSVWADDPSDSFDIMYVYTMEARIKAGGTSAIRNKIITAFNRINESFENSEIDLHANLVHMEEINYSEPNTTYDNASERWNKFIQIHDRLVGRNDGYMDEIHELRNKYSADFVHLVLAMDGGLGTGAAYTALDESYAFATLQQDKLNGGSVHEWGHTVGMQHDLASHGGTQPYAWGYSNDTIRTIMGVRGYRSQILYWSSPILYYNGMVLGTQERNARRAILENASIFCNFRKRPVTTAPTLTTTPPQETFNSSTTIEVNGESGYEVYVNGNYHGTLDTNGKLTITLNLNAVHNDFTITLKHEVSGTVSNALSFSIIKKIDTDGDGIYDHIEENLGLNPNNADSDGDGYTDLEEVGDINNPKDTDNDGIIDALDEDSDNDGISDKDEHLSTIVVTTIIVPYILN